MSGISGESRTGPPDRPRPEGSNVGNVRSPGEFRSDVAGDDAADSIPADSIPAGSIRAGADPVPESAANGGEAALLQPRSTGAPRHSLGFTAEHRRFLQILLTVFLVVFSIQWILAVRTRPEPMVIHRGVNFRKLFTVDVNSATWIDWMQLEGIGPGLAHRIEADRKLNGPFASVGDLTRVSGIGPATLDRIRPWLVITSPLAPPVESPTE